MVGKGGLEREKIGGGGDDENETLVEMGGCWRWGTCGNGVDENGKVARRGCNIERRRALQSGKASWRLEAVGLGELDVDRCK